MEYLIFFGSIVVVVNAIYFGVIYGLYKPNLDRFQEIQCFEFNSTHSKAIIGCKKIVFNRQLNGTCFIDRQNNTIEKFDIQWENLVIVIGTISLLSLLFLSGYIIIYTINYYELKKKKSK